MSIAVFLPTRKGSQRILDKSTKPFAGYKGGLLELKLKQLMRLKVDEVILSTNDECSIKIAKNLINDFPNLKIVTRPEHLAISSTSLSDLIAYVPSLTKCEHILWTHVTSPLVNESQYEKSIGKYLSSLKVGYDSLMTVNSFKNFLWSKEKNDIINRIGNERWPQTQDLEELYVINNAVFLASRVIYEKNFDRIGKNPFLFTIDKIQTMDIDVEEDFKLAEVVYKKFFK